MTSSPPSGPRRFIFRFNRHPWWSCRRTVWGRRLVVPTADRLLYVTLHQAGLMGSADRRFYEGELRPGMTVLDIGANIGLYTQLFARLVGPTGTVYAFEPDAVLYAALARGCELNAASNIRPLPYGLGETDEDRWLQRSVFNSGDNRVQAGGDGAGDAVRIALRRGDSLLPDVAAADFIKIDVQGWELHALRGLGALIERSPRLQIYLEYWPEGLRAAGSEPAALFAFLREHGFAILHQAPDRSWVPAEAKDSISGLLGKRQFVNLRAVKTP